jgi:hypothetical protein
MQFLYWLLAIVIAFGAAFWVYRADKRRAVPLPWLTSLLRGMVVLTALLLVLVPDIVINKHITEQPVVLLLQDNSRSAGIALGQDSATYRSNMESLARKLSDKYRVVQWGFGDAVQPDTAYTYDRQITDISAALTQAEELYGMQNLGAIVLATDGRFNQGISPAYRQSSYQGAIYTIAMGDSTRTRDLRIARTYANKTAALNTTFEIRADIVGELCSGYNNGAILKEGEEVLASVPLIINTDRFDRAVSFTVKATKAGLHHYTISLPDAKEEQNITNNRRDLFVEVVDEKKSILIVAAAPHPDVNALKAALSSLASYEVKVCNADEMPVSLATYDAIIAHGLPSLRHRFSEVLTAAHKPVWFVVTAQTDIQALNAMKQLTHTGISPTGEHDILLTYHAPFSAFTVPQRIQTVADKMPPMLAHTSAVVASPGSNILFTQRTPAGIMPAWLMQQGAVPTAILVGEGIWRWRLYEYKNYNEHNVVDECIRQTVAFLCANNAERPFKVAMPKNIWSDQEPIAFNAQLNNANNEPVNTADVKITIADSAGKRQDYSFERFGTGYNLNIGIRAGGRYTYIARTTYNGKELSASGSFAVEGIPLELMETGADYPLLYNLAHAHNGAFSTVAGAAALYDSIIANKRITPLIETHTETVPLVNRKWYFFVILLLAVAEWLLRKYWLAQ